MTQADIKTCIDTKYPVCFRKIIGYRHLCFGVCLICQKGRTKFSRLGDFIDWDPIHRKGNCTKRWEEVSDYFTRAFDATLDVGSSEPVLFLPSRKYTDPIFVHDDIPAIGDVMPLHLLPPAPVRPPTRPPKAIPIPVAVPPPRNEIEYVSPVSSSKEDWESASTVSLTPEDDPDRSRPNVNKVYLSMSAIVEEEMNWKCARAEFQDTLDDLEPEKHKIGKGYDVLRDYCRGRISLKELQAFLNN